MGSFQLISISDNEKWDSIIKGFDDHDVYYLSGYAKASMVHGDGEPMLFYYQSEGIKAVNIAMKRDIGQDQLFSGKIPEGQFFDITTPYGYGGFLIQGNAHEKALRDMDEEYSELCTREGIISEIARFHPLLINSELLAPMYDILHLGRTVTLELSSREDIWNNLTGKNRNVIRKARNSGVEVYWGRTPELLDKFMPLYHKTLEYYTSSNYYYFKKDYYRTILEDLRYNSLVFFSVYKNEIIAMSVILFSNKKMHYHLSGSDSDFIRYAPNNLLLFETACWGCENGYKLFHLGGGRGSKEDSLFDFKKAFNKKSNTRFSIGRKIFDRKKYDHLIEIREQDTNFKKDALFFPSYRCKPL